MDLWPACPCLFHLEEHALRGLAQLACSPGLVQPCPHLPHVSVSLLRFDAAPADTEAPGFGAAPWRSSFALISESQVHTSVLFMTLFPLVVLLYAKSP